MNACMHLALRAAATAKNWAWHTAVAGGATAIATGLFEVLQAVAAAMGWW